MEKKVINKIGIIAMIILAPIIIYGISQAKNSSVNLVVKEIKAEYFGEITAKFNPREKLPPLFLRVKANRYSYYEFIVSDEVIDFAEVGDTILKQSNDNIIHVFNNKKKGRFTYKTIREKIRKSKNFPNEWKDKWLDTIYEIEQ